MNKRLKVLIGCLIVAVLVAGASWGINGGLFQGRMRAVFSQKVPTVTSSAPVATESAASRYMTKADLAKRIATIVAAKKGETDKMAPCSFIDIPDKTVPYLKEACYLNLHDIMPAVVGNFYPDSVVRRSEAAQIFSNAYEYVKGHLDDDAIAAGKGSIPYADVSNVPASLTPSYYFWVDKIAFLNISDVAGWTTPLSSFFPNNNLTPGEAKIWLDNLSAALNK